MPSDHNPYNQYQNVLQRFDKLKKSFEHLVSDNIKLQDKRAKLINPYEQRLSALSLENKQLKAQLELRNRWDKENLPNDQQEFISKFMEEHATK